MFIRSPSRRVPWTVVVVALVGLWLLALIISGFVAWRVHGPTGRAPDDTESVESSWPKGGGTPVGPASLGVGWYSYGAGLGADGLTLPESATEAAAVVACADIRRDAQLAVEQYYVDTSSFPEDLDDLYPGYLSTIPICPDGVPYYVASNLVVCPIHGVLTSSAGGR